MWGTFRPQAFPQPPASREEVAGRSDVVAALSSRGPTDFWTVKPDLVAPGTCILAARAGTDLLENIFWPPASEEFGRRYAYLGGTSMAAPCASGAAAVLRQYLRVARRVKNPSAALVKALLLATVTRLESHRPPEVRAQVGHPDFDQGFGRLDLSAVLPHAGAPRRRRLSFVDVPNDAEEALQSRARLGGPRKSSRTYQVRVAKAATVALRVLLAWTDPPGKGVQNSLQVTVTDPQGRRTLGNPEHLYMRDALANETFDKRNNVQQVIIREPAPGPFTLRVFARSTVAPPQGYALCVCGELSSSLREKE